MTLSGEPPAPLRARPIAGPRSPLRVMQIVETLAEHPDGLTLTQLGERLGIPKTSLHTHLKVLQGSGHLSLQAARYQLGPAALRMGSLIASGSSVLRAARPMLERLVRDTHESALLGVLDAGTREAVYIERQEGLHPVRYAPQIGMRRPLYCTAFGRMLLAFQPEAWIDRYLAARPLPSITRHTVTDPAELRRVLAQIRKARVAITAEEHTLHAAAVAAPVFDRSGTLIAAIGVALPADRLRATRRELVDKVTGAGREVSWALGAPG